MKTLIACLGYELEKDGTISTVLENRLHECVRLAKDQPGSTLLLLGGRSFRDTEKKLPPESEMMKEFILNQDPNVLSFANIITEDQTTSTVEQICYLREFIDIHPEIEKVTIISSEFFNERVKLYVKYILKSNPNITFIAAKIPDSLKENFETTENLKLKKAEEWLSNHTIGDYKSILQEQQAYQNKIINQ